MLTPPAAQTAPRQVQGGLPVCLLRCGSFSPQDMGGGKGRVGTREEDERGRERQRSRAHVWEGGASVGRTHPLCQWEEPFVSLAPQLALFTVNVEGTRVRSEMPGASR